MKPALSIAAVLLAFSLPVLGLDRSTDLIHAAQQVSVARLDPGAPNVPLDKWLAKLAKVPVDDLQWKVQACGASADGRSGQICVEGRASLSPMASAIVSVSIPTQDGSLGPPALFGAYVTHEESQQPASSLRELQEDVAHLQLHPGRVQYN